MAAPFLILITKKNCPYCEIFAPSEGSSEWKKILDDVEITSQFHIRYFKIGFDESGIYNELPIQFNYVKGVPKILVVSHEDYTKAFSVGDGESDTVISQETVPGRVYDSIRSHAEIKKWLLAE